MDQQRGTSRTEQQRATPSIHRSFLVRVYADDGSGERLVGLVEHVISGRAAEFASVEDLVQFMRRVLSTAGAEQS